MQTLTEIRPHDPGYRPQPPSRRPPCSGSPSPPPDAAAQEGRVDGIARAVAQGAVEVLDGSRPAQQLCRWLDPDSYERLRLRAGLMRSVAASSAASSTSAGCAVGPSSGPRASRCVAVRSARLCRVSDSAFEAALVVLDRTRARAVALRIERQRGDWKVTALEIG